MGFQNKWIGFFNLSKYRAQGLFKFEMPALSADSESTHLRRGAQGQLISNLLFLMEAEVTRTKKWAQGGQTNLNRMSPGVTKAWDALDSLEGSLGGFLAQTET